MKFFSSSLLGGSWSYARALASSQRDMAVSHTQLLNKVENKVEDKKVQEEAKYTVYGFAHALQ